jgi:DNA mismatch repair protein MutS
MIIDDFLETQQKYEKIYGPQTVVLYEVGSFYENYGIEGVGDVRRVAEILNIQATRKNKAITEISRANHMLCGFPSPTLDKHLNTLVSNGFTVVLVQQTTPPPNPKREVTEIVSPSMTLTTSTKESNNLMVVYVDTVMSRAAKSVAGAAKSVAGARVCMGFAVVDATTGQSHVYEAHSRDTDRAFAMDELTRMVHAFSPKEVVLMGCGGANVAGVSEMVMNASCEGCKAVHERWDVTTDILKPSFQNAVIGKVHELGGGLGMLSPIEALNLERYTYATVAYCYMLQFIQEHNDALLIKLSKPDIAVNESQLNLQYNSAVQLNIIGGEKPLMSIINRCSTSFGSRMFKQRLLTPVASQAVINDRLDYVEKVLAGGGYVKVRKSLTQVLDIERIRRKIAVGTFQPMDWMGLDASLKCASDAASFGVKGIEAMELIDSIVDGYSHVIDLTAASKWLLNDIKGTIFVKGVCVEIDDLEEKIQSAFAGLHAVASKLGEATSAKVDSNDRDGHFITTTKKRFQDLVKAKVVSEKDYVVKPISASSSVVRITNATIDEFSDTISTSQQRLGAACCARYKQFLADFDDQHGAKISQVAAIIAELDVAATCAHNAVSYGYTRPVVVESAASHMHAKGLRHPVIERLQTGVEYTTNDVTIDGCGMLLYGINAVGKSSLMKSVGLNIVMAQAGMYVACGELTIAPFSSLFTRIPDGDNIFRGQSTFTVEMTELRNILQRCDARSLVLGDELCSGTEAVSAISIVAAGIQHLASRNTGFIFATHLHDLVNEAVFTLPKNVDVCHMHIEVDPETKKIVYHRKLRPGSGSALYGLEVCKAIGLPPDFIDMANEVRKRVCDQTQKPKKRSLPLKMKKSAYNAKVYMDVCGVCQAEAATETHHIKYQQDADENGFVAGGSHKNDASNLVPLCEECHKKEHNGFIKIHGYIHTTHGRELSLTNLSTQPS